MNRTRAALATVILVLAAGTAVTDAASAHEGEGILTLESQQVAPEGSAAYRVRLTWENDGHAAIDSTVTATPIAPDGTPGVPVVMDAVDQDGRYAGNLTFPDSGTWTVRFTAVTPAATAEVVEEITLTTTTGPVASGPPMTEAITADVEGDGGQASGEDLEPLEDDDSSSSDVVIILTLVVLLLVAIVVRFTRSNRRLRDGP